MKFFELFRTLVLEVAREERTLEEADQAIAARVQREGEELSIIEVLDGHHGVARSAAELPECEAVLAIRAHLYATVLCELARMPSPPYASENVILAFDELVHEAGVPLLFRQLERVVDTCLEKARYISDPGGVGYLLFRKAMAHVGAADPPEPARVDQAITWLKEALSRPSALDRDVHLKICFALSELETLRS